MNTKKLIILMSLFLIGLQITKRTHAAEAGRTVYLKGWQSIYVDIYNAVLKQSVEPSVVESGIIDFNATDFQLGELVVIQRSSGGYTYGFFSGYEGNRAIIAVTGGESKKLTLGKYPKLLGKIKIDPTPNLNNFVKLPPLR